VLAIGEEVMNHRHSTGRLVHLFVALIAVALCTPGLVLDSLAQPASGEETVTIEFRPMGAASGDHPLVFSFHGRELEEPLWLISTDKELPPLAPGEEFLRSVIETNGAGTPEDLLALWNPEERPAVFAELSDEQAFAMNRSFYRSLEQAGILAELHYGTFTIFVVVHAGATIEEHIQLYPVLRSAEGYFLSNQLQEDPVLQFVFLVYEDRLAEARARARGAS
jgi:hypothetical protein